DAVATADTAAEIDAAHAGQHHVQQHQVGLRLREQFDRLLGGAGGQHRVVICAEVLDEELHNSGLVLDDEHGCSSHVYLAPSELAGSRVGAWMPGSGGGRLYATRRQGARLAS